MANSIDKNRKDFIAELKSGKHKIGCQKSDERGYPIFEKESDKDGSCACAIMGDMFGRINGKISLPTAIKKLGLKASACGYIQREINDKEIDFNTIAERIENEVFA